MADRHQRRAEQDGAVLAEHAVGKETAEQRRQINEPGVKAINVGGEGLWAERPNEHFKTVFEHAIIFVLENKTSGEFGFD